MNWKAWTPLAVAIVLGLLAARLAMEVVNSDAISVVKEPSSFTTIVVAARDIEPGVRRRRSF